MLILIPATYYHERVLTTPSLSSASPAHLRLYFPFYPILKYSVWLALAHSTHSHSRLGLFVNRPRSLARALATLSTDGPHARKEFPYQPTVHSTAPTTAAHA